MQAVWQLSGTYRQPRWRLALCSDEPPQRRARHLLRELREKAPESTFCCTECNDSLNLALVAIHPGPVGAHLADPRELPAALHGGWSNPQDRALVERGYDPGVLHALKLAASRARIQTQDTLLNRYVLVPMPHIQGLLLVNHRSGWQARALAWWQAGALLSLAWSEDDVAKLRRAC